jgi:glycosyltransferase involved in cell wall biosynthesis
VRIVYVGPVPPLVGGVSQHGGNLVRALEAAGHQVEALSWRAQYPRALYPGGQVDRLAEPLPGARWLLAWHDPWSWWQAGRTARHADLLVFPWVTPVQAPVHHVLLSAAHPTPAVADVHNVLPHERRWLDLPLTRSVMRRLAGAVVYAQVSAAALQQLAPGLPVSVARKPPDLQLEATGLPPAPPYRLLVFGLVRPYKGVDVALEAVARLVARSLPVELTVAGQFWGPVEPWRRRVAALGLERQVRLRPGYLPDAAVAGLFAAAHLLLVPYRSATQSGVVPLAAAAGRGVVATAVGGLAEQVHDGVNGLLVPPGDPDALAAGIERALGMLDELAAGARRTPASWSGLADLLVRSVTSNSGRP